VIHMLEPAEVSVESGNARAPARARQSARKPATAKECLGNWWSWLHRKWGSNQLGEEFPRVNIRSLDNLETGNCEH
jgi:hypothetical protein